jgi:hypothetical protein
LPSGASMAKSVPPKDKDACSVPPASTRNNQCVDECCFLCRTDDQAKLRDQSTGSGKSHGRPRVRCYRRSLLQPRSKIRNR